MEFYDGSDNFIGLLTQASFLTTSDYKIYTVDFSIYSAWNGTETSFYMKTFNTTSLGWSGADLYFWFDTISLIAKDPIISSVGHNWEFQESGFTEQFSNEGSASSINTVNNGHYSRALSVSGQPYLWIGTPKQTINTNIYKYLEIKARTNAEGRSILPYIISDYDASFYTDFTSIDTWQVFRWDLTGKTWDNAVLRVYLDDNGTHSGNINIDDRLDVDYIRLITDIAQEIPESVNYFILENENDMKYNVWVDSIFIGIYNSGHPITVNQTVGNHTAQYQAFDSLVSVGTYLPSIIYEFEYEITKIELIIDTSAITIEFPGDAFIGDLIPIFAEIRYTSNLTSITIDSVVIKADGVIVYSDTFLSSLNTTLQFFNAKYYVLQINLTYNDISQVIDSGITINPREVHLDIANDLGFGLPFTSAKFFVNHSDTNGFERIYTADILTYSWYFQVQIQDLFDYVVNTTTYEWRRDVTIVVPIIELDFINTYDYFVQVELTFNSRIRYIHLDSNSSKTLSLLTTTYTFEIKDPQDRVLYTNNINIQSAHRRVVIRRPLGEALLGYQREDASPQQVSSFLTNTNLLVLSWVLTMISALFNIYLAFYRMRKIQSDPENAL
jgi:hypothetical protein